MLENKRKFIGRKFGAFHRARELAVQFLCSLDICPEQDFEQSLELFLNLDDVSQNDSPEVKERCRTLSAEVWKRKSEIDGILLRVVTGWRPERMVSVDRTILRLMVLEGFMIKSLPVKSAIAEAGTLANDYGTKDSARFVNGVMYRAVKYFEEQGEQEDSNAGD
ncbi:MAG: transcription antitermination protein NusB [Synergistaceae bacterium]|nr:transcription antitermination protein NusB [Synergistaceae bacterium]